jgi:drug/metabolite transporter (DMT)-like permease
MIWLLLCAVLTATFFLLFKTFPKFEINTLQAIVFNYITCVIIGLIINQNAHFLSIKQNPNILFFAAIVGIMFLSIFFLMAKASQEISVASSTTMAKISMLIPISFTFILNPKETQSISLQLITGILFGIISLFLIVKSPKTETQNPANSKNLWILLAIFFGSGIIDTLLNYATSSYKISNFSSIFPMLCFGFASIAGSLTLIIKKSKFEIKNLVAGIILGIPNYFSIYTLLKGLDYYQGNGALAFPIVHISSILLSVLSAGIIFREKLHKINYLGVLFAVLAVLLLCF